MPCERRLPPIATVGSIPAASMISAISEVVVVLPWVPATATPTRAIRSNSPSISARAITGILSSRARTSSGLENFTADEITTASSDPLDEPRQMIRMMAVADFDAERGQPLGGIGAP